MVKQIRQVEAAIAARGGRMDPDDVDALRKELYTNGRIGRLAADHLIDLRHRLRRPADPLFTGFFRQAIKDHVLKDGRVAAEEVAWLREMLFADGAVQPEERDLLAELHAGATHRCPEFEALVREAAGGTGAAHSAATTPPPAGATNGAGR